MKKEIKKDCIMLFSNISKKEWKKWTNLIEKDDVYDDDKGEYGIEDEPHITLLYGIHNEEVDREFAEKLIKTFSEISLDVEQISIFENEEFDVVKLEVIPNDVLLQYRKTLIDLLPNSQTYPDYHPHLTISYVKKGCGKKYVEKLKEPVKFSFNEVVYSDFEYNKKFFKLKALNENKISNFNDFKLKNSYLIKFENYNKPI